MKRLVATILFLMVCVISASAQKDTQPKLLKIDNEKMKREIDSSMKALDSINERMKSSYERTRDSIYKRIAESENNRNLDAFVRMQIEREAKRRRAMWMKIGVGVLFLGVLIFGIMRRRKKTT